MLITLFGKRLISGKIIELYGRDHKGKKVRFMVLEMRLANKKLMPIKYLSRKQFNSLPEENLPLTDLINLFGNEVLHNMETNPIIDAS